MSGEHTVEPQVPPSTPAVDRRRIWARRVAVVLSAGLCAALIVRFTVRDRFPVVSLFFYAAPWPIYVPWFALVALLWRRAGYRRAARVHALAAAAVLSTISVRSLLLPPPPQAPQAPRESIRVMFWNVARTRLFRDRLASNILHHRPDVIGLVEAGESNEEQVRFWKSALPDFHQSELSSGMLLLSRVPIEEEARVDLGRGGRCRQFSVRYGEIPLRIFMVDIKSNPLRSRREPLEALNRHISGLKAAPLVIMGDFNTPADSVWFDALRENTRHVFETAGHGYFATWPMPVPVMQLDHMWTGAGVTPVLASHDGSVASDHRAIVAELLLEESP